MNSQAGNPYEKFVKEGTEGYLEPRKSFKTWSETVVGKCREWTEEQVETAAVLCLVYGKFIEVSEHLPCVVNLLIHLARSGGRKKPLYKVVSSPSFFWLIQRTRYGLR